MRVWGSMKVVAWRPCWGPEGASAQIVGFSRRIYTLNGFWTLKPYYMVLGPLGFRVWGSRAFQVWGFDLSVGSVKRLCMI